MGMVEVETEEVQDGVPSHFGAAMAFQLHLVRRRIQSASSVCWTSSFGRAEITGSEGGMRMN